MAALALPAITQALRLVPMETGPLYDADRSEIIAAFFEGNRTRIQFRDRSIRANWKRCSPLCDFAIRVSNASVNGMHGDSRIRLISSNSGNLFLYLKLGKLDKELNVKKRSRREKHSIVIFITNRSSIFCSILLRFILHKIADTDSQSSFRKMVQKFRRKDRSFRLGLTRKPQSPLPAI